MPPPRPTLRFTLPGIFVAMALAAAAPASAADIPFTHPGLLHSQADLDRMQHAVAARQDPIFSGYQRLLQHPQSQLSYRMQGPLPAVGRNGGAGQSSVYDNDATAAYHFALLWTITGDHTYADRSREIVNAWSRTLKKIDGRDAVLMAGLAPFKMVNAAEILRYTPSGFTPADALQAETCFQQAVYPTIKDYALFANGNWDTAAMKTVLAIGVFCNDRPLVENALRYYADGPGDGALTHYVINDAGQCQESGRDAGHSQLGLAHLGDCCEVAWNQGLDLYGYANNRLLKGFEYAATHNVGGQVPFTPMLDRTGKYPWAVIAAPGPLRPVYEQIYAHYVSRLGIDSPALQKAVESLRPEGPSSPIGDHPGFGTLLFARPKSTPPINQTPPTAAPASPAALIATGTSTAIALTWVPSISATTYVVKRATSSGGPYTPIASDVKTPAYSDKDIQPGTLYFYAISATNPRGQSPDSFPTAISAGMPTPWKNQDLGNVKIPGWTKFDGHTFTLDASGRDLGSAGTTADQAHFAYLPLHADGTITARFVPQMSAMRSRFGLMMRESLNPDAPNVALLITPATNNLESPGYDATLTARPTAGAVTTVTGRHSVPAPFVAEGRFMEPYWLRLTRTGDHFQATVSPDGQAWTPVGDRAANGLDLKLKTDLLVGLSACSGILQTVAGKELAVDTVIKMDHVAATGWTAPELKGP